jgi:hypothetical protein
MAEIKVNAEAVIKVLAKKIADLEVELAITKVQLEELSILKEAPRWMEQTKPTKEEE